MSSNKSFRAGAKRKGQMFLIGAVIIVVALFFIKSSINVAEVLEKKKFLEAGLERVEFDNIRSEVQKAAFNGVNYSRNLTNVTNSFVAFAENRLDERTIRLEGVSIVAEYGNLSASTDARLNVTTFNFFDTNVTRAVLNLSTNFNAPITTGDIGPGRTNHTNFTFNIASTRNLTLWAFYETAGERVVANITIPAEVDRRTKAVVYFDIRMVTERGTIRDKFSEVVPITANNTSG